LTWPASAPNSTRDYFMYKPGGFTVSTYQTINTQASDHLPVVATVLLQ